MPESFAPERFEGEPFTGAYLPFGLGPRACIGRGFALLEAGAVLSTILRRFELAPASSQAKVELEAQISLHPRGGLPPALASRATPTT